MSLKWERLCENCLKWSHDGAVPHNRRNALAIVDEEAHVDLESFRDLSEAFSLSSTLDRKLLAGFLVLLRDTIFILKNFHSILEKRAYYVARNDW